MSNAVTPVIARRGFGVLLALLATACSGAPQGGLYALDCSNHTAKGARVWLDAEIFGRHPEEVVLDETSGRIFSISERIDGPILRDACDQKLLACVLKFSPEGGSGSWQSKQERGRLTYDRKLLRFDLSITSEGNRPATTIATWNCKAAAFPSELWKTRTM